MSATWEKQLRTAQRHMLRQMLGSSWGGHGVENNDLDDKKSEEENNIEDEYEKQQDNEKDDSSNER